ncbi:MAG: TolB family protein [Bacteroidota bacterium]
MKILFTITLFFLVYFLHAQASGDIYIVDIHRTDSGIVFNNLQNVTQHKGYDNQPCFSSDNKYIYFTSMRSDSTADIYRYDIMKKQTKNLSNTPLTSEFSPKEMPGGKYISVVMVEKDGKTQRLWKMKKRGGTLSIINKELDSVGYYQWKDENHLTAFILGKNDIHTLRKVQLPKSKKDTLSEFVMDDSVGRCFYHWTVFQRKDPWVYTTYFSKSGNKVVSATGNHTAFEINAPGKGEDFVFDGFNIWMADGNRLTQFNYTSPKNWIQLKGFDFPKIKGITRLAISPDGKKLAFVAEDGE